MRQMGRKKRPKKATMAKINGKRTPFKLNIIPPQENNHDSDFIILNDAYHAQRVTGARQVEKLAGWSYIAWTVDPAQCNCARTWHGGMRYIILGRCYAKRAWPKLKYIYYISRRSPGWRHGSNLTTGIQVRRGYQQRLSCMGIKRRRMYILFMPTLYYM